MRDRHAPTVVVLGSVHMDLIATADRLPGRGESVGGGVFTMAPGGKGGNQACQFVLAGTHAHMVTRLGADAFGRELLAGLQTISPALYEAAAIDGATPLQRFRNVTLPMLSPIIAVVMTFSVLFTFTDFQLIWVLTRGGPINATHLMATLSFQRAIPGGALGEGAAIATAMIPFLLAAILFSYFGLQRRRWQQGGADK